jgi:hypothetical protein
VAHKSLSEFNNHQGFFKEIKKCALGEASGDAVGGYGGAISRKVRDRG